MTQERLKIEVVYALPEKQKILVLEVAQGCSAREAVKQSGIENDFPEIDPETADLGIFGNALGARGLPAAEEYQLKQGDRVEIYRPLIADPKEVRRQRAAEAKLKQDNEASS